MNSSKNEKAGNTKTGSPQQLSVNESILKSCFASYMDAELGLLSSAKHLGIEILPPRKKITVMLMGNHSAGKSTFINWYLNEKIQNTGVAIETQGFTFVTCGKKREVLKSSATFQIYPHFLPLERLPGVSSYISTEVSTSKERCACLCTFIDTPGLVDGEMQYPFDVNEAIINLGQFCDLVLIFFDPVGQALCKRTIDIVDRLNTNLSEKLRFYLSKADTAGSQQDRQKVMMQITQELCRRPSLNRCGLEMPTIYVESETENNSSSPHYKCDNQIEHVCGEIEKTLNLMVQNTLDKFETDCKLVEKRITEILTKNRFASERNSSKRKYSWTFFFLSMFLPFLLVCIYASVLKPSPSFFSFLPQEYSLVAFNSLEKVHSFLNPAFLFMKKFYVFHYSRCWAFLIVSTIFFMMLSKVSSTYEMTLSKKDQRYLENVQRHVNTKLLPLQKELYQRYLKQSIGDEDLY